MIVDRFISNDYQITLSPLFYLHKTVVNYLKQGLVFLLKVLPGKSFL